MSLTYEQMMEAILAATTKANPSIKTQLEAPRVGGKSDTGVWTGIGAGGLLQEPTSAYCMRAFNTDVIKNHTAMLPIETYCKRGLKDSPELLFCMPDEPNNGTIVNSIHAFHEHVTHCGFEGIFNLTLKNGKTLNMLLEPGMVNKEILKGWCDAVMTDGVPSPTAVDPDGKPTIQPKCPYDRTNMLWSGDALLNSCTETLRQDLKLSVPITDRNGPHLMMTVLIKLYRPSQSKIRDLRDRLESLDIRKYPAENVTQFSHDATQLVREIKMNYMENSGSTDLTATALNGLIHCSDEYLRSQAKQLRIASDANGFLNGIGNGDLDPIEALQKMDALYRVLVNQKAYGPALTGSTSGAKALEAKALAAMVSQAIDTKLSQDRSQKSSGGNSGGKVCYDCQSPNHFRGDPSCPKKATTPPGDNPADRHNKHGLPDEVNSKLPELIKAKFLTMPARENIPDEAQYDLKIDGKIVAKYCRHCGRFVKGASQHYTPEHKGTRFKFSYVGPASNQVPALAAVGAATPAPAPAMAAMASFTPSKSTRWGSPPDLSKVPTISTADFENRRGNYDMESIPQIDEALADALNNGNSEDFMAMLGKGYGR